MFAGSIQDRLRARDQDRFPGRAGYPVNVSGHQEKSKDYSHSCHHIVELKEKQRRIEALQESFRISQEAQRQMMTEVDHLKDKLEESQLIHKRDAAIIESQKHAIAQLQLALRTQQKAVESIFNASSVDTERELRQLQASDAKLREALTPSPVQRKPPQTQTVATPSLSGLVSFGEAASEDASEGSSEISLAPPTAKLYTPGTTPRTDISSPRSPSPGGAFI